MTNLLHPGNRSKILQNLVDRLVVKNEGEATEMLDNLNTLRIQAQKSPSSETRKKLQNAALEFPNFSHPSITDLKDPRVVFDNCQDLDQSNLDKIRSFEEISKVLNGSRTSDTGQTSTEKSYYLLGPLAELEQALIHFTVNHLITRAGFQLVSVPDLLNPQILEACGLKTTGEITNVFKLDERFYGPKALSGTAEMAFGSLFANQKIEFPVDNQVKKFAAVSRCYRAESTMGKKEKGLYRVHHFTKVEMFALTPNDPGLSNLVHEQMLSIQQRLFDDLLLHYRVLDMHPGDLGAPASRKYDCEAILPGNNSNLNEKFYGEISSTSNCLDYQSRRLNLRDAETGMFCHTINGTACAVPRMIMAICEQKQLNNGCVNVPEKLRPYMPSMENSIDDFLGPRPKSKRPVFQYKASPKAFLSNT